MPTYDYRCKECQHVFELFHSPTQRPRDACPACGCRRKERLLGTGSGVIFKGSGFYETDYRKESYNAARDRDAGGNQSKDSSTTSSEKKPSSKAKPKKG